MTSPRLFSVFALLSLGACGSARGGGNSVTVDDLGTAADLGGSVDATSSDLPTPLDSPAPHDAPLQRDVVAPLDVPAARCGDGTCDEGESCASCRADCASTCPPPVPDVPAARCGDGTCNGSETCTSCRTDCVASCPPPTPDVPAARCGDGTCNPGETCTGCASDCGACTGTVTDPCAAGVEQGLDRNCGWRTGTTFTCSAGRATMVGCSGSTGAGSLCQPSYGTCVGDPVMRVCPDSAPCTAAAALVPTAGSFDDQCGACPSAYVTCPASGRIHVLTGDFDANQPTQRGTCTAAVR